MSILCWGSGSDKFKPDSTDSNNNLDGMTFNGAGITISATAHVQPGATCYKIDPTTSKVLSRGTLSIIAASANEALFGFVFSLDSVTVDFTNLAEQKWFGTSTTRTVGAQMTLQKNGTSTSTVLAKFYYDNVAITANTYTMTVGKSYRVHVYLKKGATGTGDCTYKVYIDDVTSADIAVGAATLTSISSTTVTMTNAITASNFIIGCDAGGLGFGALIGYFEHCFAVDTAGSGSVSSPSARALDPVCVTKGAFPTAQGADNAWTSAGSFANLAETPPDDATTTQQGSINVGGAAIKTTYTMTAWASIGNSTADEILAVRGGERARGSTDGSHIAALKSIIREGGTDTIGSASSTTSAAWVTLWSKSGNGRSIIANTPPTSGGTWTIPLHDATEIGAEASDLGFVGTTAQPQLTLVRKDALFVKKPALAVAASPQQPALMGLSGGII